MKSLAFRSFDPFTQEEFAAWLPTVPAGDLHRYELLDGFIVREPPAGWPHGEIEAAIVCHIGASVETGCLGRVFGSSQGFELPTGDTVEPDVSFVSVERWRALPQPVRGFPRVVPDLVVEILSPSTSSIDQGPKKRIYERCGVREYWLVDPDAQTVSWFSQGHSGFGEARVVPSGGRIESRVIAGLSIRVEELFPDP